MPEEINRIVTDSLSDMLFVTEPSGAENLRREGHPEDHIHLGGQRNDRYTAAASACGAGFDHSVRARAAARRLRSGHYAPTVQCGPCGNPRSAAGGAGGNCPRPAVGFSHPSADKTAHRAVRLGRRLAKPKGILVVEPLGYLDFLALTSQAKVIVTDSGGLQEESTALEIPCLTLRYNTERPITVEEGSSTLVGNDPRQLAAACRPFWTAAISEGVVRTFGMAERRNELPPSDKPHHMNANQRSRPVNGLSRTSTLTVGQRTRFSRNRQNSRPWDKIGLSRSHPEGLPTWPNHQLSLQRRVTETPILQTQPELSVVLPCLNEAETLERCIARGGGPWKRRAFAARSSLPTTAVRTDRRRPPKS